MTINKSEKILSKVPDMPSGEEWVYQMGVPLQLSATEAGLFCSIRRGSVKAVDFEVGNDLIPFDSIDRIKAERAVPLIRSTPMCHPETGDEQMLSVYPVTGGFVPLGAKMDGGGRIHPHAGTGFGVCQILGYPSDLSREPGRTDKPLKMMGIQQYTYDGTHFTVSSQGRISEDQLYPGWRLIPAIMSNAIPDGEDLVCGMCGVQSGNTAEKRTAGVARWRYSDNKWSVIGFTPVAQQTVASGRCTGEPSLIRIKDGSLLFMARGVFTDEEDAESVLVWRSTDRGATWKTVLKKRKVRTATPVTIHRTVDGSAFIAGNPYTKTDSRGCEPDITTNLRESIVLWPLSDDRFRLLDPVLLRDCSQSFPPPADGSLWRIDHPTSAVVRLSDGKWHCLLVYRILTKAEVTDNAPVTPYTGCYLSEIISHNTAIPTWSF